MRREYMYIILLLLFLLTTTGYSQKIINGYYKRDRGDIYLYVQNDTIILPYATGTMGIGILKGVIDNKRKWINFIPVKDKMESSYSIVEKKKNDCISILRFNLYSYFGGEMLSSWYDGSSIVNETFLWCHLVYATPQNKLIKKDTALIFNGKYFEIGLSSDLFINAELTVRGGGKYITVPILKDTLLFVDIVKSPFVFYHDKHKRMKFKYSEEDESIEIMFNLWYYGQLFNRYTYRRLFPNRERYCTWQKFIKSEKPHENNRFQQAIEKHIKDMQVLYYP